MSFLVILLFLGGIIVLFVYICTLISRIKIIVIDSYKYFIFIVGLIGGFRLIFLNQKSYFVLDLKNVVLSAMYQKSRLLLLVVCIIYLLMVLFVCVKIVQKHKGGLKSKTYDI